MRPWQRARERCATLCTSLQLLGRRFRYYSYGTILTLLVFGALASLQGGRMATNQPTPWMGVEERINIYATMLWGAVLAIGLLRAQKTR